MNNFNFADKMCLSVMAGVLIGMACLANLLYGGVLGAFLFAFGLSIIIYFKFHLYTGAIGNVVSKMGPRIIKKEAGDFNLPQHISYNKLE